MPLPAVLSLVTLGVRDVTAATRFYEDLGFPLADQSVAGEVSFFRTAGALLGLYGRQALADDARLPAAGDDFDNVTLAVNVGSREEVDAALAHAADVGARIVKPAQATEWGGYHGYFCDPDGHAWEVAHNPFWPIGADGMTSLPA